MFSTDHNFEYKSLKDLINKLRDKGLSEAYIDAYCIATYNAQQVKDVMQATAKVRLENIREEIRQERVSFFELAELRSLKEYIEENDVELLEWAGVEEKH